MNKKLVPIKAIQNFTFSPDGISMASLGEGETSLVNDELAETLIKSGLAESLIETKEVLPNSIIENKVINPKKKK